MTIGELQAQRDALQAEADELGARLEQVTAEIREADEMLAGITRLTADAGGSPPAGS